MLKHSYTQDESERMHEKLIDIQALFNKYGITSPSLDSLLADLRPKPERIQPLSTHLTTQEYAAINAVNKAFRSIA